MRTISSLILLAIAGNASAFDTPPTLLTGKFNDGAFVVEVVRNVPQTREVVVKEIVNEMTVEVKKTVTGIVPVVEKSIISLDGVKITQGGKTIEKKKLAELLAEETVVVTSQGPLGAKYKELFKDDVILLEFPLPKK